MSKFEDSLNRILEAYEDEAHPSNVNFWKNLKTQKDHPYGKHPLMAMYGDEISKKSYESSMEKARKIFGNAHIGSQTMRAFQQAMHLERPHRRQLEQFAKELVNEIWDVPMEIMDARLVDRVRFKTSHNYRDEYKHNEELQDHVNKRITMNAITQGAAVHNMMTAHKLIDSKLQQMNPQLSQIYDKFAAGSHQGYWQIDLEEIAEHLGGMAAGAVHIAYDDNDKPKIIAQAINFPILVQELIKGAMELMSYHGLADFDEEQLRHIYDVADRSHDEHWLIQAGPHLWKIVLQIVPKGYKLSSVIATLSSKDPDFVHKLLSSAIEDIHADRDPQQAKEIMARMMEEDESEYEESEYEDEENDQLI